MHMSFSEWVEQLAMERLDQLGPKANDVAQEGPLQGRQGKKNEPARIRTGKQHDALPELLIAITPRALRWCHQIGNGGTREA